LASDDSRPERLFIGVPVSTEAREAIARALPKNLPGKPVALGKWHFTLRFLGATKSETRDKIIAGLSSALPGSEFQVRFGQLGAFPNPRRARVLWLGLTKGSERLIELAAIAENVAQNAGFAAEARVFKPHLTLSRIDPPTSVAALLDQNHRYDFTMTVTAVILYRSKLGGGPATYEEVARFPLSPRSRG